MTNGQKYIKDNYINELDYYTALNQSINEAKNIGIFSRDDVYDNESIFDSPIYPANSELYDEFCDECGFDIAEYFLFLARQIENN